MRVGQFNIRLRMANGKKYPTVRQLIIVFFGQDFDIFGETIDEIMESYLDTENEYAFRSIMDQATQLLAINDDDELNSIMVSLAENEFEPRLWGETWRSFLQKVLQHLPE